MIRIRTAASKTELETLANQMEAEGFRMVHLAFRMTETWAVFESAGTKLEPIVSVDKLAVDGVNVPALQFKVEQQSKPQMPSSFKRGGRR